MMDKTPQTGPGARRAEFVLGDTVYMNGNSLGPLPKRSQARIREVVDAQWGVDISRSWNVHDWINLSQRVGDRIGNLIGAAPGQIVVGDSTSVCLFKLAAAALLHGKGSCILTDSGNFPTDLYVLQGLTRLFNGKFHVRREPAERILPALDADTALVVLTHVDYKTSAMYEMREVTAAAHARGALMLWDLSHSTGAVPVQLDADGVDLAVGCTYKYLNGGPGAPAFSFVAQRLQEVVQPVVTGWMGHRDPFTFSGDFVPAAGIRRTSVGTPEVLALSVLDASLDLFESTGMELIREQSVQLSELFIELVDRHCAGLGLTVASPRDARRRGSQVSLTHQQGYAIVQALSARGIVGDFRAPDLLRFGFAPLYQTLDDVRTTVSALQEILTSREWDRQEYRQRSFVT